MASAKAAADLQHAGVKGAIREALIADLFRPLLPADFGVSTGVLISSDDKQSAQQDIVVFDRRVLPPLLLEGPALIPVESALATIEVKSCLTASELRSAQANALTVRNLPMLSGVRDEHGDSIDLRILDCDGNLIDKARAQPACPFSVLFALDSDLIPTGKSELDRYAEVCSSDPHVLRGICIVGRGFFGPTQRVIYDRPSGKYLTFNSEPLKKEWSQLVPADDEHEEVLALVAGIHNLVLRIAVGRGQPSLSGYLQE